MKLRFHQKTAGCADGTYRIKAKGCIAVCLHWADQDGPLPGWSPLAYCPIDSDGNGVYTMTGGRAIPPEATHIYARAVSDDFSETQHVLAPIPKPAKAAPEAPALRLLVMTDLHLGNKPWYVKRALSKAKGYDAVLIAGDITNDGTREQMELFWQCVTEVIPDTPVFTVTGKCDTPLTSAASVHCDYSLLQKKLLDRAAQMGIPCRQEKCGAYVVTMGDTDIIGLNASVRWRRYALPDSSQLTWLMFHLLDSKAKRYIILCHAPLPNHRPFQEEGDAPYPGWDDVLQRIVDVERKDVIFLSGHTHVSMNCREGCVEMVERENPSRKANSSQEKTPDTRRHLYINAGSIRPTTLKQDEPLQPACWAEGNVVQLLINGDRISVTGISVTSRQKFSRGHYVFDRTGAADNRSV